MLAPARLGPRRLAWIAVLLVGLGFALLSPRVVAPVAVPNPKPNVRLLNADSPLFDRAELADPALLVLPPLPSSVGAGEGGVPEATPFPPIPPDLRSPTGAALKLALGQDEAPRETFRADALPDLPQPLETLGQRMPRALPLARAPMLRATTLDGGLVIERNLEDEDIYKSLINIDLISKSPPVLGLGVDAFGLQAPPVLLTVTGSPAQDRAILEWAARQPWSAWLPPGSYRVEIGP